MSDMSYQIECGLLNKVCKTVFGPWETVLLNIEYLTNQESHRDCD